MAKGQVRTVKEQRKKKSVDKKDKIPRYMRGPTMTAVGKASVVIEPKK